MERRLQLLEYESMSILKHALDHFQASAMLWSMGKDSTALLWMLRKICGGIVPIPLFHIDTSFKIPEMIKFRERLRSEWNLPLHIYQNQSAIASGMNSSCGRQSCCGALKTQPLLNLIKEHRLEALLIGIRRDEEGSRSKEKIFSRRNLDGSWDYKNQEVEIEGLWPFSAQNGQHYRELDIWNYIAQEKIPFCDLYLSKNGKRYRSLGCSPCTQPVESQAQSLEEIIEELKVTATTERSGRSQDTETAYGLEKLRRQGYM